jgi:hypothetical protein
MNLRKIRRVFSPLVLISVGLSAVLLAIAILQFSRPVPEVLIAKRDLSAGQQLSITDFEPAGVSLPENNSSYFMSEQFPSGSVLAKSIGRGEILAKSQVQATGPKGFTMIRFKPELPVANSLRIGDLVGLWVVTGEQFEQLEPAVQLAVGRLVEIQQSEGLFADEQPYVEITIPESTLPEVLKSMASDHKVFLVEPGL